MGFLLGLGQAALDEKEVKAFAFLFGFHGARAASGAALDQVFGDLAEAGGSVTVVGEFSDGLTG